MANKLAELEEGRNVGNAGAQERLKLFRAERILFVDSIIQVSCRPRPLRAVIIIHHIELPRI